MNYYQHSGQCQNDQMSQIDGNDFQNLTTQMIQQNENENPFCPAEAFMLGNYFSSLYVPYCGLTNYPICPQTNRQALLARVMMLEFNMHELNLYLDTHPNDQQALDQFHVFHKAAHEARDEYQKQFGPLAIFDVHNPDVPWAWSGGPWPWERQ